MIGDTMHDGTNAGRIIPLQKMAAREGGKKLDQWSSHSSKYTLLSTSAKSASVHARLQYPYRPRFLQLLVMGIGVHSQTGLASKQEAPPPSTVTINTTSSASIINVHSYSSQSHQSILNPSSQAERVRLQMPDCLVDPPTAF
ncbi:unnamed protein product [Leuciscus chuanchicus]